MLRTDRKTAPAPKTVRDRERTQQKKSRDVRAEAAAALEAILAGGSREQLPAEGVLSLSHTIGNAALSKLLALRPAGPETAAGALPRGACETAPLQWDGGAPLLAQTPDFGAMSPIGSAAPLTP